MMRLLMRILFRNYGIVSRSVLSRLVFASCFGSLAHAMYQHVDCDLGLASLGFKFSILGIHSSCL